ncbi:ABC transporter substrate-binding protein [Paracoccus nototheniae]|uniref:ABC transporter substrate-binding protein n=1 Tax=Paracoccus nototheniae TaxID=2489002 RepID=A0ABW4E2T0_9RHOB|nr:ABC transporter substrate-binding protein [Paracoccus nototheniae]
MDEGSILRVALDWQVDEIDPPRSFGGWNTGRVVQQTHESLMEDDFEKHPAVEGEPTALVPRLAISCEISNNECRFLFRLRSGIRFHDGAALDAEAVVLNYARMCDPSSKFFSAVVSDLNQSAVEMLASVRALDPMTVEITTKAPAPDFLRYMTQEDAPGAQSLVSPLALQQHGPDGCADRAPGTGPFRFHRRFQTEHGSGVELVRNDDYWGGAPKLSGIRFLPFPDLKDRVRALREGEVDLAYSLEGANLEDLAAEGFSIPECAPPYLWYLVFNSRDPQIGDVRIRRAIAHAINRNALSSELFPGATVPAVSALPPGSSSHNPQSAEYYPYDPQLARALLAEAGVANRLTLRAFGAKHGSAQLDPGMIYARIAADLAAVGIKLEVELHPDWVVYCNQWRKGAARAVSFTEMSWGMSSDLWLRQILHSANASPTGFNAGFAADPLLDDLLDRAAVTLPLRERIALYRMADARIMDQLPILPLLNSRRGMFGHSPSLRGLTITNQCWNDFRNVWLE